MKILVFVSLLIIGCYSKKDIVVAGAFSGKVIKIVDGDTYDILADDHTTIRIRMEGIDAPERRMPFYQVSKDYLGSLCFGKIVRVQPTNKDRYGRIIAKTYLENGSEMGLLMVQAGYAWHYKKYSSDIRLADAEAEAKNKHTGLWVDEMPTAPWDWRKRDKVKDY